MEVSFWVKTNTLRIIQMLVGNANARFKHNPIIMGNKAYLILSFDLAPYNYRKFLNLTNITQQPFF